MIDASGFAYRAYFATPLRAMRNGTQTHAVIGFLSIVARLLARADSGDPPTHAAAVFDAPGPTFRHKLFPAYKAGRKRPDGLTAQLPLMRHAAMVLGLAPVEVSGVEADDVIATLAAQAAAIDMRTTVVSVDKDLLQLVEDDRIEIVDPVQRARFLAEDVRKKHGIGPERIPDYLALCGDAVDNIPGVPGIGHETAVKLLRRFGSLDGVIRAASTGGDAFIGRQRILQALRAQRENLRLYRKLATVRRNVRHGRTFDELRVRPMVRAHVEELLRALEASDQVHAILREPPPARAAVEPEKNPFAWWQEELRAKGQQIPAVPQCGYYSRRLFRGAELTGARIWHEPEIDFVTDRPTGRMMVRCTIGTADRDPYSEWGYLVANPITKAEYEKLMKLPAAKDHPPTNRDFTTAPVPTFKKRRIV